MNFISPFLISFCIVFFSELGDKTQLLVMSYSTKRKTSNILLGVAIGTFLSHGVGILFGSKIGSLDNAFFNYYLKIFTYISFLLFGIWGFIPKKQKEENTSSSFLNKLSSFKLNYIIIIAISIIVGEIGDKTFLASLGLSFQYPDYKFSLILGSVCGMVASNMIAICFGKLLGRKLKQNYIEAFSNILFIIFGILGLIAFYVD